jgi:N-methylhydantoinase B
MFERLYPILYERCEFRTDAGGAGEYRGGTGLEIIVRSRAPMRVSYFSRLMLGDGFRASTTFGVSGGSPGAPVEFQLLDGTNEPLGLDVPGYEIDLDTFTLVARTEGGGGWGDPRDRDPERVAQDVLDELVSEKAARSIYGPGVP